MSSLINGDGDNDTHDFRSRRIASRDDITEQLLRVPAGHHCLVLYSNIDSLRNIYSTYAKRQIEECPDSVLLLLSYYDTTDNVRNNLSQKGIRVKELERNGSVIVLDIAKTIDNPYFEVPDVEWLRELAKKLVNQFEDKTVVIIADMSVFHHIKRASHLLEYEKDLHKDLKVDRWKEICLYHRNDFKAMFTEEQSNELLECHKDKVVMA
jgi:MEDS: MEthanogen/methylotroph, DcmR Sensory domain